MDSKSIFVSKTFWVNLIAIAAMTAQGLTGKEIIPLEMQGTILGAVNVVLRLITKQAVTW